MNGAALSPGQTLAPGVALVVCTRGRPLSVARFLSALARSTRTPDQLLIVDASDDRATEMIVLSHPDLTRVARDVEYVSVEAAQRGLTRQRNVALAKVRTDLVAFFDDDIVLGSHCLARLEAVHRNTEGAVVGVAAAVEPPERTVPLIWQLRRWLGIVPDLQPGAYYRSGMSIPWHLVPARAELVRGDWLPGGATMWKTTVVRQLRFHDGFDGYGQGEDLEFSLRARHYGALFMAHSARALHLHEPGGRPDPAQAGYQAIRNWFAIHERTFGRRAFRSRAWFAYAFAMDSLLLARNLVRPRRVASVLGEWRGRLRAALQLLAGRRTAG